MVMLGVYSWISKSLGYACMHNNSDHVAAEINVKSDVYVEVDIHQFGLA